jgi:hypothetical protein
MNINISTKNNHCRPHNSGDQIEKRETLQFHEFKNKPRCINQEKQ